MRHHWLATNVRITNEMHAYIDLDFSHHRSTAVGFPMKKIHHTVIKWSMSEE